VCRGEANRPLRREWSRPFPTANNAYKNFNELNNISKVILKYRANSQRLIIQEPEETMKDAKLKKKTIIAYEFALQKTVAAGFRLHCFTQALSLAATIFFVQKLAAKYGLIFISL